MMEVIKLIQQALAWIEENKWLIILITIGPILTLGTKVIKGR